MDTGRRVLLSGSTAEDAAAKMCEFFRENDFLTEEQADSKRKANWLEEMVEYRELLQEDAHDLGIETSLFHPLPPCPRQHAVNIILVCLQAFFVKNNKINKLFCPVRHLYFRM